MAVDPLFLPLGVAPPSSGVDPSTLPLSPTVPVDPSLLALIAAAADNATITTTRRGAHPLLGERVQIKPPTGIPAIRPEGYVVLTEIVLRPDTDILQGDSIHIDQIDGFTTITRQEGYSVSRVIRLGGAVPQTRIYINGTIQ